MSPLARNRMLHVEFDQWLREGLLTPAQHADLAERYSVGRWDWHALGRWFSIFGGVGVAAGLYRVLSEAQFFTLPNLAMLLAVAVTALFGGAYALKKRSYRWPPRTLELLGAIGLVGLSFVLGMIFSTGSGNWPALLLIDLVVLVAMSYAFNNILLMVLSSVVFFVWFGGATGYEEGWGAYWFGMNYPLRFLGAAAVIIGAGAWHYDAEAGRLANYRGFAKVWISCGLFFAEMALWLLSIFGNFGDMNRWYEAGAGELVLFNALWALGNAALLGAGVRLRFAMLRGYAVTFLVIQGYTLYFSRIAPSLGFVAGGLLGGGSALGLVIWLEARRRQRAVQA